MSRDDIPIERARLGHSFLERHAIMDLRLGHLVDIFPLHPCPVPLSATAYRYPCSLRLCLRLFVVYNIRLRGRRGLRGGLSRTHHRGLEEYDAVSSS